MNRLYGVLWAIVHAFACCAVLPAAAAETARKFVLDNTEIVPIRSQNTGRDHELVIVLPESYAADPQRRYPVFYYTDAYWDTPLLAAIYGNLRYDNQVPEFIMVGLSYPAEKNYGAERRLDYTITRTDDKSGGAGKFLAFIQREVAPLIESRYRGRKTDRVLGGVSLGGLFTLHAAYSQADFFAGYIAISPGVEWDKQALARVDEAYARSHKSLSARVFISYGTAEYAPFRDPIKHFQETMAQRQYQGLALMNYAMEGLDHVSVKGDGYVRGLMWVWLPQKPAGPSGLERDFKAGI